MFLSSTTGLFVNRPYMGPWFLTLIIVGYDGEFLKNQNLNFVTLGLLPGIWYPSELDPVRI